MTVWARLRDMIEAAGSAAMVTVVATRGSTPREAGARLIVGPDGRFSGTIGGGTLEWKAIALAQALFADPRRPASELRRFSLGPELGQCCGGDVQILIERFDRADGTTVADFAEREAAGPFVTEADIADGVRIVRRIVDGSLAPGTAALSAGRLTEGFGDERRPLFLFGAGHVGRALTLALAPLPFSVTWIDPRRDAFPAHQPQNVKALRHDDPAAALGGAPDGAFILVMTHSHQLDLAIVLAALADGRFPYVGLIGSKSKRARFEKRLAEAGVPADRIAGLVCPIGVEGVSSKHPAVIAAATVAELLVVDEALRSVDGLPLPASRPLAGRLG